MIQKWTQEEIIRVFDKFTLATAKVLEYIQFPEKQFFHPSTVELSTGKTVQASGPSEALQTNYKVFYPLPHRQEMDEIGVFLWE